MSEVNFDGVEFFLITNVSMQIYQYFVPVHAYAVLPLSFEAVKYYFIQLH